ncbi:CrcB family protein [Egicoccus sp. AB-alg6-2]|uniref:CrcB family protein n=1 Tax=Egicoccus sp. AB-alg6-2 TaxID=3242692 RepID=UPI00359D0B63
MSGAGFALVAVGIAVAGAAGAVVRHLVLTVGSRHGTGGRAGATAACNLGGALLLAAVVVSDGPPVAVVVIGFGFCGALTTFSTWTVDAVLAWRSGRRSRVAVALVDLVGQLTVGIGLVHLVLRLV